MRGALRGRDLYLPTCRPTRLTSLRRLVEALPTAPRAQFSFRAASISKLFGETVALWDVDLAGSSGGLVAVPGGNASGKSTLLRLVAGVLAPTRGRVAWTTPPGIVPRIALLGHGAHLFEELTVLENVSLAARLAGRGDERALVLVERVGAAEFAGRRVAGLSAGTRRRVGLARALAADPDVLLVDEPWAGLDAVNADIVGGLLGDLRAQGRLVVIASHDDARSRHIATTSVWLEAGRLRPGQARTVVAASE